MRQTERQPQTQPAHDPSFESTPWVAREVVLDERADLQPEPPLALEQNDHVVDTALDGEAIRRAS
jgi:hypothetical protein